MLLLAAVLTFVCVISDGGSDLLAVAVFYLVQLIADGYFAVSRPEAPTSDVCKIQTF